MAETIAEPRPEINENAPSIQVVKIDPDQIGMVIGKGGETIRGLEEEYTVSIGIGEDGTVQIYGVNKQSAIDAAEAIESMTKEIEVGEEFDGSVVKLAEFGAFVELKRGTDGLLHVSRMGPDRVERVEDVVAVGDVVGVKVVEVDSVRGRIALALIRDPKGNAVELRPSSPRGGDGGGAGGDRPRGGRGGSGGGDRGRGGSGGGGGSRGGRGGSGGGGGGSRGGNRSSGGGSSRPRSEGGDRPRGEGGDRPRGEGGDRPRGEGGDRPRGEGNGNRNRNRSRGGSGGGGQREGGGEQRQREPREPRNDAPKQADAPAPAAKDEGGGRRFKFRLRGGDDS
jgi:predicted RNA-binding protein with RPS1 domain